jgi:hypothetical protein
MKRILFAFFFISIAFVSTAQTAEEIVSKHIEAIGGTENWKKINSLKMEGAVQVQGAEVALSQTILNGKGSRQDISVMGMTGFIIITPTAGWSYLPFQGQQSAEAMTAEDLAESQDQLDIQGSLVDYAAKGNSIELLGKDDVEGTECYKIKVTKKTGNPETYFIDTKTHYIVRSMMVRKANGQETTVTTNYSNYEKTPEGVLLPKSIGLPFGELNLSKITVNLSVDESIFKN